MISEAVTKNWKAMVQSFFLVRGLPWEEGPLGDQWSLASCFHKIERVHRSMDLNDEMLAVSLFLLAVFDLKVETYIMKISGADTTITQSASYVNVGDLNVEYKSSNPGSCTVRLLSVQGISCYMIPLIPKFPSRFNFISLAQLASFVMVPVTFPSALTSLLSMDSMLSSSLTKMVTATSSGDQLTPLEESLVDLGSLTAMVSEVLIPVADPDGVVPSCDLLPPLEVESITEMVSGVLIPVADPDEVAPSRDLLPPPEEESISSNVLAVMLPVMPPAPQRIGISLITDDWELVNFNRIDDLTGCLRIHSSKSVFQEYFVLCNSVEVPCDVPPSSNRESILFPHEGQDCWELVTLCVIDINVVIIKIELMIFSSEYFICIE